MRVLVVITALSLVWALSSPAAPRSAEASAPAQERAGGSRVTWPVDGAVVRRFEPPSVPYGPGHRGVDLAADPGTEVRSAMAGRVSFAGEVAGRGWVTVDHGGGLDTTYGVLDPRMVSAGQAVAAGEVVGRVAAGARHLDWGARLDRAYIDPLRLFGRWRPHLVRLPR